MDDQFNWHVNIEVWDFDALSKFGVLALTMGWGNVRPLNDG